ncbi:hypothetical protein BRC85_06360 [Halobacteriales archaeon QS_1_69_70]|nr:MAG: hypothetical protein BRC85_06360 [Halobacteriales archaeon QS_1_69_70]
MNSRSTARTRGRFEGRETALFAQILQHRLSPATSTVPGPVPRERRRPLQPAGCTASGGHGRGPPPAVVATPGYNPLSPEGEAYAERLGEADVDVVHHHSAGPCHGF